MGWQDDARCRIAVVIAKDTQAMLEDLLNPEKLEKKCECRVVKHPDACSKCRANNDCKEIPMHPKCRCVREYVCF